MFDPILDGKREGVRKNFSGLIERYAMFSQVAFCFCVIPLKTLVIHTSFRLCMYKSVHDICVYVTFMEDLTAGVRQAG